MPATRIDSLSVPDGSLDVHVWIPAAGRGPGIVLVHEIFGVAEYIQSVAERLRAAGYVVAVPDLFWRFAPGWVGVADPDGTAAALANVAQLDHGQSVDDLIAVVGFAAQLPEVDGTPGVLGFCLGGTLAFGLAASGEPAACVAYYGSGIPDMLDRLDEMRCPALFHFGSTDAYIPGEGVERLAAAIADREDMTLNVEIAGHAFDNDAPMFHDEAAARAAWAKTMAFLAQHLPVAA